MKIVLSDHVIFEKIPKLKALGWKITQKQIRYTVSNPKWKGIRKLNQETAMSLVNEKYILRVIFDRLDDIIFVITVHIARRGRYESS